MLYRGFFKNFNSLVFLFATFSTLAIGLETLKNDTPPKKPWEDPFKDSPNPLKNPTPGIDSVLFKDTTPREFFAKRLQNREAQERLKKAAENYQKSLSYLKELSESQKKTEEIDSTEKKTTAEKEAYLALVGEHGHCAVGKLNETPEVRIAGLRVKQDSIGSDGSCQNLETDKEKLKAAYKRLSGELKNLATYRQHNEKESNLFKGTGTASVLQMTQVEKGVVQKEKTLIPLGTFFPMHIGVKGPEIGVLFSVSYYVNNYAREWTDEKGIEHFAFSFSTQDAPPNFNWPALYEIRVSGTRNTSNKPQKLKHVVGQVYTNSDGYFRYSTESILGSDFKLLENFIKKEGRKVLLDTIVTFSNRTFNEVKQ